MGFSYIFLLAEYTVEDLCPKEPRFEPWHSYQPVHAIRKWILPIHEFKVLHIGQRAFKTPF